MGDLVVQVVTQKVRAENEQLRRQRDMLLEACEAFVNSTRWIVDDGFGAVCCYCGCPLDTGISLIDHAQECPITKARAAIAAARGEEVQDAEAN